MLKTGGSITVHSRELASELLGTSLGIEERETTPDEVPVHSPHVSPRHHLPPPSPTRVPSRSSTAQMTRIEDWLSRKARRAVVSLPDDPELTRLKDLCQTISDNEHQFLSELDSFLTTQEERRQCKREILYRKWCERVFEPVQNKLTLQMASRDYQTLDSDKRGLFNHYLDYRNRKQVFLDTISPEEYNPLKNGRALKVSTGPLDDPLISQRTDYNSEQLILKGCDQGFPPHVALPPPPDGREDTDCVLWLAMQLVHIDSEARQRSRARVLGVRNKSSPEDSTERDLDIPHKRQVHYNRPQFELKWEEHKSS